MFNLPVAWKLNCFIVILLWSSAVGVTGFVVEALGPITATAAVYGLAGIFGTAWHRLRGGRTQKFPTSYVAVCGSLFVV